MCFNHVFLSKKFVNLAVWNINGIKSKVHSKVDDKSFVDCIQSYDVIGLVETHLTCIYHHLLKTLIFIIVIEPKTLGLNVTLEVLVF